MEDLKSLNLSLKSLTLQDLNLDDEASHINPDSYPPVMIPLSAPRLKRHSKPPRLHPMSAPVKLGGGKNGDIFFGINDEDEEEWEMSYHQRRHSRYPVTEDCSSVGDNSQSGSLVTAMSVSSTKKVTNPWKSSKCTIDQSSLWKKPGYTQMVTSPLVPKVIPVAERAEVIMQEFLPSLNEFIISSELYEIKSKIKNAMIRAIKLRAIEKPLQTKSKRKQLLQEVLTAVTTKLFEDGTELRHYDVEDIESFLGNMAFIGYMGRLNIVDERSTLCAISHLCRQHQREQKPALIIGAEAIVSNSRIDLCSTPAGRVIFEYLCLINPNPMQVTKGSLEEQFYQYKDLADYSPDENSVECLTGTEFYDLYDSSPTDLTKEDQKVP